MLTLTESAVQAGGIVAVPPEAADSSARTPAGRAGERQAEIRLGIAPPPGEKEELVEDENDEPTEVGGDEPTEEDEEASLRVRSGGLGGLAAARRRSSWTSWS